MNALIDLNPFGLSQMSLHRQAEWKAVCSRKFKKTIKNKNIRLMTYRDLISELGLKAMKSPFKIIENYSSSALR